MADAVYNIETVFGLRDEATEGLNRILESLKGIAESVGIAEAGLRGLGLVGVATGVVVGLNQIASAAEATTNQLARLRVAHGDTMQAMAAAQRVVEEVPTLGITEALQQVQAAYGVMGEGAFKIAPELARFQEISRFYGQRPDMNRILGMLGSQGLTTPGRENALINRLDNLARVIEATQGAISPDQLLRAQQIMGIRGLQMSPDFINNILPQLMLNWQGAGRGGPGAALAAAEQAFGGGLRGRGTGFQAQEWQRVFGARDPGEQLFRRNPYEWAQIAARAMKEQGFTDEDMFKMASRLFQNPRAAAIMADFFTKGAVALGPSSPYAQLQQRLAQAPGATQYAYGEMLQAPSERQRVIGSLWGKILEEIGKPLETLKEEAFLPLTRWLNQIYLVVKDPVWQSQVVEQVNKNLNTVLSIFRAIERLNQMSTGGGFGDKLLEWMNKFTQLMADAVRWEIMALSWGKIDPRQLGEEMRKLAEPPPEMYQRPGMYLGVPGMTTPDVRLSPIDPRWMPDRPAGPPASFMQPGPAGTTPFGLPNQGSVVPQMWPGPTIQSNRPIWLQTILDIDGRTIAEAITSGQMDALEFSSRGASNMSQGYASGGHNTAP